MKGIHGIRIDPKGGPPETAMERIRASVTYVFRNDGRQVYVESFNFPDHVNVKSASHVCRFFQDLYRNEITRRKVLPGRGRPPSRCLYHLTISDGTLFQYFIPYRLAVRDLMRDMFSLYSIFVAYHPKMLPLRGVNGRPSRQVAETVHSHMLISPFGLDGKMLRFGMDTPHSIASRFLFYKGQRFGEYLRSEKKKQQMLQLALYLQTSADRITIPAPELFEEIVEVQRTKAAGDADLEIDDIL